jgi:hypothetical protein
MLLIHLVDEEYAGKPLWVAKLVATHISGATHKPIVSTDDPIELSQTLDRASAFYQCPVVDFRAVPSPEYLRPSIREKGSGFGIDDVVAVDTVSRKGRACRRVFKVLGVENGKVRVRGLKRNGHGDLAFSFILLHPNEISFVLSTIEVAEWTGGLK